MSLLEDLLAPIEGEAPEGPDLRSSNEFAEVEKAFLEADQPSAMTPAGADLGTDEDFDTVVELSTDFLQTHSKDLKVAVFLTASLLRVDGFKGLADGLELILGLMKEYWDGMHPGIPSRGPTLDWFGSDDLSYAIFLQPLTEFGHRYRDYKEWLPTTAGNGEGEPSPEEADEDDFESAFGQTSRDWYEELTSSLQRCNEKLAFLDAFGKEKFPEADEKPPRYNSLADALKKLTSAAEDLLGRKPAPPKPVTPDPEPVDQAMGGEGMGGTESAEGSSQSAPVSAMPKTKDEATTLVGVAARVLRRENPGDPSSYLLIRGLRWGELRAGGEHVDPRWLEPPTTVQRTRLKTLFLDRKFEELLDAAEEIMATPAGRGWLDLQRYAVLAAERLGPDFQQVATAIRGSIGSLLEELPSLIEATLMDDSPTASRDTLAWLTEEGLLEGSGARKVASEEGQAMKADRIIRESGYDRAAAMARSGDPQGAVELLMDRAEHERSSRARFVTKSEAVGIMVSHGMGMVARPILDDLLRLIDEHQLESWEPAEIVSKPMGIYIQALEPGEDHLKAEIYPRLAKLDPVLAMEVDRTPAGSAPVNESEGYSGGSDYSAPEPECEPEPEPSPPPSDSGSSGSIWDT